MKKSFKNQINAGYQPAEHSLWKGRKSTIENQYWYQKIELLDIKNIDAQKNIDIALLGYVCDEGVRRNQGRIGAKFGPKAIREKLAKLPIHFDGKRIADVGDIICLDGQMEDCQNAFSELIKKIISKNIFPIALGGGHDIAFGHFMGIYNLVKNTSKKRIGIVNFDAHFDLRSVEDKPNSGTPFNQIINKLKSTENTVDYFAIGIQQQSNTKQLFDIAKKEHVEYVFNYDCESSNTELQKLKNRLQSFIDNNDYIYITIDLDGFSSAYAPGVSAPSPLGFTPNFVFKILTFLFSSNKVISCDIAELNPTLDSDAMTANLAARIVDFIVMSYQKQE